MTPSILSFENCVSTQWSRLEKPVQDPAWGLGTAGRGHLGRQVQLHSRRRDSCVHKDTPVGRPYFQSTPHKHYRRLLPNSRAFFSRNFASSHFFLGEHQRRSNYLLRLSAAAAKGRVPVADFGQKCRKTLSPETRLYSAVLDALRARRLETSCYCCWSVSRPA